MAGGLLNLKAEGANNVILNGNPSKTFFKVVYSKYSNFGLQKFRIDYDGLRELRPFEESKFTFKVPRYADLLMDTYLSVTMPHIWSPIYNPTLETDNKWSPYDFKWIRKLGVNMIKEVVISCGTHTIQKYSGEYLDALVERDFSAEKKELFNKMSGNVEEMYDPANVHGRANTYPSAFHTASSVGAEPSIRGRTLYIPLNTWFSLDSKCPLPLVSLQYNQIEITVTMRPIQELYQVRDVFDGVYNYPYVKPDLNENRFQIYRFLQTPPSVFLDAENYGNKVNTWNADIHLISTYCFLSKKEQQKFAMEDQVYLIKEVQEHNFENVTGTRKLKIPSNGLVSSWMWFMRRNDVHLRNEWSNYTNWPYITQPGDIELGARNIEELLTTGRQIPQNYGPAVDPKDGRNTGFYVTGNFKSVNRQEILETFGILMNGDYRENMHNRGVYDYVEKYVRTRGAAQDGLYCYNFCLNTNPFEYQPSGAFNMSMVKTIEVEITTHVPDIDLVNSRYDVICNIDGDPIGTRKSSYQLFDYNYNLTLFEERYNILSFIGGNCGLMYAH